MKIIGLDFDNTLTNYDSLFYEIAKDLNLIPHDIKATKVTIRDYLRSIKDSQNKSFINNFKLVALSHHFQNQSRHHHFLFQLL